MTRNITVGISDELIERMDTLTDVNWSAVTRNCIESYIKQRSAEGLESAISIIRSRREEVLANGYAYIVRNSGKFSLGQLEEFLQAYRNMKGLEERIKEGDIDSREMAEEVYEKYRVDYDALKKMVYALEPSWEAPEPHGVTLSIEFIKGMMEAVNDLFEKSR